MRRVRRVMTDHEVEQLMVRGLAQGPSVLITSPVSVRKCQIPEVGQKHLFFSSLD